MITRMDRDIGRLLQLVKDLGLDDNTIVVFTSDNGAVFPLGGTDPKYFKSNAKLHGYKQDIYEGGIRLPLIVRWKGHVPQGDDVGLRQRSRRLDADAFGSHRRGFDCKACDGISFAPTLLGKSQPPRPFLYRGCYFGAGGQQSVRVGDWKLLHRRLLGKARNRPHDYGALQPRHRHL